MRPSTREAAGLVHVSSSSGPAPDTGTVGHQMDDHVTRGGPPPAAPPRPPIVEREEELAGIDRVLASTGDRGHVLLVSGDAGTGKSTLLEELRRRAQGTMTVRIGRCDALTTPAPFGPLWEMRLTLPPEVVQPLQEGRRELLFAAMLEELTRARSALVVDDVHWADEATIDLLRYLGRRITETRALLVCASRSSEVDARHPLRPLLGELGVAATRIDLRTLTVEGVARLVGDRDLDPVDLYAVTGGNPFFVSQMLADPHNHLPATVEDAVLARTRALPERSMALLEYVGIAPEGLPLPLLPEIGPETEADADAAVRLGLLMIEAGRLRARHELIRRAFEATTPPNRRRRRHARLLELLEGQTATTVETAVLAHHAVAAGDAVRTIEYGLQAAHEAARDGAHREAAAHFEAVLRHREHLDATSRHRALERAAYERYLIGDLEAAHEAIRQALDDASTPSERGRCLRFLSRVVWFRGDRAGALQAGREAVGALSGDGADPHELGYAYSNLSQLAMLDHDEAGARTWGERAIEVARAHDDVEVEAHALNNIGTAVRAERLELVSRSLRLSLEASLHEHAARAYTNLAYDALWDRNLDDARRLLDEGLAYTEARDLETWWTYMLGTRAELHLVTGDWARAVADAERVRALTDGPLMRQQSGVVAARLAIRRSDPSARTLVDEVLHEARRIGEYIRLLSALSVATEYRWHTGERTWDAATEQAVLDQAVQRSDAWALAAVAPWLLALGEMPPGPHAPPVAAAVAGDTARAVAEWRALGCSFEAALTAALGPDPEARRTAVAELADLGADGTIRAVRQHLASRGVADLPRGPNRTTREHPAGLTARQVEVLELLVAGASNSAIAEALFISPKTVEHHVSAVLAKLGASSRNEAVAVARERGLA